MRYSVLSCWACLALAACGAEKPAPPPPPEVTVAEARAEELAEWDDYQGEFEAIDAVEVRPRVSGYLIRVAFTEGNEVRKGDVLFEIDPQPYQATLDERKADLARAEARLALTERDAERGERLVAAQAISQEEQDTRLTLSSEARAGVQAAEAAVRAAELDLGYTKVRAPVDGRTGRAEVTEGNLVIGGSAGESTRLTTIVSLDPIYVYFEGDESAYLRYAHLDRTGERVSSRRAANPVQIGLADEEGFPHSGRMDFVDNRLDRETGTIRARAVVANRDRLFTPGMFARVRLLGSGVRRVTVIPEVAVSTDQDRKFVFVLNPDSTVAYRSITLGRQVDGQRRIIRDGLKPGEQVVVNGFARIRPGVRVKPTVATADSVTAAPAGDSASAASRTSP
jgi:RND family efflux transporter MFP subunit